MIKLVEWLLGRETTDKLHKETADAEQDVKVSRALRRHAETLGPALRARLAENHFGEKIQDALHQRGWTQE